MKRTGMLTAVPLTVTSYKFICEYDVQDTNSDEQASNKECHTKSSCKDQIYPAAVRERLNGMSGMQKLMSTVHVKEKGADTVWTRVTAATELD